MIDFTRAQLTHLMVHSVGNKGLGEVLNTTSEYKQFKDDFVKEMLLSYFLSPFKSDIYHQFKKPIDLTVDSVQNLAENIFKDQNEFIINSIALAHRLWDQTLHPKIKGGLFYVTYFKNVTVDGVLTDAVGLFKTETLVTYLKVDGTTHPYDIDYEAGINIKKLDKGCLIFNIEKESGYKLSIIDLNNKFAECASYWNEDFLNAKLAPNAYYHTKNFIDATVGFCEEILTDTNGASPLDKMMIMNTGVGFLKDNDRFEQESFNKEILKEPVLIDAFKEYKEDYYRKMDLTAVEDFDISQTAIKKNKNYLRSVVKLDQNFHIYIHSRHDFIEKGYDEEKGMKFYKLYFTNETN